MSFPFLQNSLMRHLLGIWVARQVHQDEAVVDAVEINASVAKALPRFVAWNRCLRNLNTHPWAHVNIGLTGCIRTITPSTPMLSSRHWKAPEITKLWLIFLRRAALGAAWHRGSLCCVGPTKDVIDPGSQRTLRSTRAGILLASH